MNRGIALVLTGTLSMTASAHAASACKNPEAIPEITDCAVQKFEAADRALNKAYSELLRQQKASDADSANADAKSSRPALLKTAQKAWLVFRDAECEQINASDSHAPIYEANYIDCQRMLTEARTAQLRDQLDPTH